MSKVSDHGMFHELTIESLRHDRKLAVKCAKQAVDSLNDPEKRGGGLLTLRTIAEAYSGLATVAKSAGISRMTLYRSLSAKGNPTLKTLLAVLNTLQLSPSAIHAPESKQQKIRQRVSA